MPRAAMKTLLTIWATCLLSAVDARFFRTAVVEVGTAHSKNSTSLTVAAASHSDAGGAVICQQRSCVREGCKENATEPRNPNCCTEHMFDMLVATTQFLDRHKFKYVLAGGSLLGAVRSQSMIPWTSDVDIVIFDPKASLALQRQKEIPFKFFLDDILRGCSNNPQGQARHFVHSNLASPMHDNGNAQWFMDVYTPGFSMMVERGHQCLDSSKGTKVTINGMSFAAPDDPHACARRMYGDTYMTPTPSMPNDRTKL